MSDVSEGNVWERYAALEAETRAQTTALMAAALAMEQTICTKSGEAADRILGDSKKSTLIRESWPLTTIHVKTRMQSVAEMVMIGYEQPSQSTDGVPSSFESTKYYNKDLAAAYEDGNPRGQLFLDLLAWADEIADECPVLLLVEMGDRGNVGVSVYPQTPETEAYLATSLSGDDPTLQFGRAIVSNYDAETAAYIQAAISPAE